MTTEYTQFITIVDPPEMLDDLNQLALVIGESIDDDQTFNSVNCENTDTGEQYCVISTVIKPIVSDMVAAPLVPPAHAPHVDIAAASRAQALLRFNVPASPDYIAVDMADRSSTADEALERLGLTRIPSTEEA